MTHVAMDAAERLAKDGVSVEVVDLRSLRPLDEDTIIASVQKTHRCVIVHEGWPYGGVGAEIADRVQRLAFDALDAPVLRVSQLDVPMPYSAKLEQLVMPQPERVDEGSQAVSRGERQLMAKVLEMPKLSPTMEEGVLTAWHKKEGDAVVVDDLLAEVETDKATMEFRAFDKGTLLRLLVPAGATVKLGQPVAILGSPGEDVSALVAQHARTPALAPHPAPAPTRESGSDSESASGSRLRLSRRRLKPASPRAPDTEAPPAQRVPARTASALDRTEHLAEPAPSVVGERTRHRVTVRSACRAGDGVSICAVRKGAVLLGASCKGTSSDEAPAGHRSTETRPGAPSFEHKRRRSSLQACSSPSRRCARSR